MLLKQRNRLVLLRFHRYRRPSLSGLEFRRYRDHMGRYQNIHRIFPEDHKFHRYRHLSHSNHRFHHYRDHLLMILRALSHSPN